jgi:type I restriction-modification system DNA methylase subunit
MMEEKLVNNEETEKFKHAVYTFFRISMDWPTETYLIFPLMFYLAKEKTLKIGDPGREYRYALTLATHQGITLFIDEKAETPTIMDILSYTKIRKRLAETKHQEFKKHIIEIAETFISLSDDWFRENAPAAFEFFFERCYYLGKRGRLPKEIIELVKLLLNIEWGTVYNPHAGTGEFIEAINEDTIYHGQEASASAYIVQLRLLLEGKNNATIQMSDPSTNWKAKTFSYDYIIANAIDNTATSLEKNRNLILLHQISRDTKLKAIGIFPASICFSLGNNSTHTKVINQLIEQDILETVIKLPPRIIPNLGIVPILIVINKMKERPGMVHFIDANNCCYYKNSHHPKFNLERFTELLKDDGDLLYQAFSSNESIIENNYNLNPSIYITKDIPTIPEGFQLIALKQLLNPCELKKTVATEGLMLKYVQSRPYSVLNYSDLSPIDTQQEYGSFINHDFLAVKSNSLSPYYVTTENHPVFVSQSGRFLVFKVDTTKITPSYLLSEMSKDYFQKQTEGWRGSTITLRISSEQFLELKILVPEKFEDQVTLALEAGKKDLKDQWKRLNEQYEEKLKEFRQGQRLRKHAVAQVLGDLFPAVKLVTRFVENNDNFGPNSIVGKKNNKTLLQEMQSIHQNLVRVVDMVSKFTDLENYSDGESIQINEFLEDYCRHILTNEKYRITLDLTDDIYWTTPSEDTDEEEGVTLTVKIGRAELIQILDNLITNAHKHGFTDPNRMDYEIRLTTEVETKDTSTLLLKVANNGEPVSRSIPIEQLFTWGISNGKTEGSGLGCWQAKAIAEHYKGKLTYQEHPEEENGFVCEFTLSLPLHFD